MPKLLRESTTFFLQSFKRVHALLALLVVCACANVLAVREIPQIVVGEPSFFRTIEAHTDAPIVGGNSVEVLLNGDETFPVMLRDIAQAKTSITFAQYLYQDGSIARDLAQAFAERCRAGVKAAILLDSHGSGQAPSEIIEIMKSGGCHVEFFRRIDAAGIIFPWKLLRYNYRSHRRVLVIDGHIGFTGGYGISESWTGNGRTPEHWRDTNVRFEGPVVKFLQAAFAESWLETTGIAIGGDDYFPAQPESSHLGWIKSPVSTQPSRRDHLRRIRMHRRLANDRHRDFALHRLPRFSRRCKLPSFHRGFDNRGKRRFDFGLWMHAGHSPGSVDS